MMFPYNDRRDNSYCMNSHIDLKYNIIISKIS